jgi:hypothetical protein
MYAVLWRRAAIFAHAVRASSEAPIAPRIIRTAGTLSEKFIATAAPIDVCIKPPGVLAGSRSPHPLAPGPAVRYPGVATPNQGAKIMKHIELEAIVAAILTSGAAGSKGHTATRIVHGYRRVLKELQEGGGPYETDIPKRATKTPPS